MHSYTGVKLDPTREDLPIPVFILADNSTTAQKLFSSMTSELAPPRRSNSVGILNHMPQGSDMHSFHSNSDNAYPDGCKDQLSSLPTCLNKANKITFPIDSDSYVIRKEISPSLLNSSPATTPGARPTYKRTPSLVEQDIAMKRYTMQMFVKEFDRRFAHIFFRTSGLFLVTATLKELADDPLIQHENLSLWLRLIQSCMRCADEKRVIIVGMYDRQQVEDFSQVQKYIKHLNHALQENDLNKQLLNQNRNPRQSGVDNNHQYVFMFDTSRESESCFELFNRMEECMDLFMGKARHFDKKFFESTFEAFDGLNVALREVSRIDGVVGTSDTLRSICSKKTHYAIKTIAAYSTALIDPDKKGESI